jgi:hypothetical protein
VRPDARVLHALRLALDVLDEQIAREVPGEPGDRLVGQGESEIRVELQCLVPALDAPRAQPGANAERLRQLTPGIGLAPQQDRVVAPGGRELGSGLAEQGGGEKNMTEAGEIAQSGEIVSRQPQDQRLASCSPLSRSRERGRG